MKKYKAKVLFRLSDRTERTIKVEVDAPLDILAAAMDQLQRELEKENIKLDIDSFQIFPEEQQPGIDKIDGVAVRSGKQKVRFDLMPCMPLIEVARVFTFGAFNYGDRNWEAGFSWSRCIGSMWRHFYQWLMGETFDSESGLHHLAHLIANAMFLIEYQFRNTGNDDRPKNVSPEAIKEFFKPIDKINK